MFFLFWRSPRHHRAVPPRGRQLGIRREHLGHLSHHLPETNQIEKGKRKILGNSAKKNEDSVRSYETFWLESTWNQVADTNKWPQSNPSWFLDQVGTCPQLPCPGCKPHSHMNLPVRAIAWKLCSGQRRWQGTPKSFIAPSEPALAAERNLLSTFVLCKLFAMQKITGFVASQKMENFLPSDHLKELAMRSSLDLNWNTEKGW